MIPIRPSSPGSDYYICDVLDDTVPDKYKWCWCQSYKSFSHTIRCTCECHLDRNCRMYR